MRSVEEELEAAQSRASNKMVSAQVRYRARLTFQSDMVIQGLSLGLISLFCFSLRIRSLNN